MRIQLNVMAPCGRLGEIVVRVSSRSGHDKWMTEMSAGELGIMTVLEVGPFDATFPEAECNQGWPKARTYKRVAA